MKKLSRSKSNITSELLAYVRIYITLQMSLPGIKETN